MTAPIKAGDLAEVIDGMRGNASPNLGLIVRVLSYEGDHTMYGPMWRCEAEFAELGQTGSRYMPGTAHFAQSWLRKIEPPKLADTTKTEREVHA